MGKYLLRITQAEETQYGAAEASDMEGDKKKINQQTAHFSFETTTVAHMCSVSSRESMRNAPFSGDADDNGLSE